MLYSIDTSAILDGWSRYYPPDVFPALWENLEKIIEKGDLIATEEVLVELEKQDDEVYSWAKKHRKMFYPTDENVQRVVVKILKDNQKLIDTRANRSGADPFVISVAKIHNCVVVTGEKPTHSEKRPHIPDVCSKMGVKWINLLDLIREQKWKFSLRVV